VGDGASPAILLINYEYPPLGGGAANATAALAREMARQGWRVTVATSAYRGLPSREITPDGVEIRRIPTIRRRVDRSGVAEMLVFLAASLVWTPVLAAWRRPKGIIAFFGLPCGPAAWLTRLILGTPYVVSLRGGDVPGFRYEGIELYHRLSAPVIGFLWRRAAAVVANSDGLAELARRFAPDMAIPVTHNGVDPDRFKPAPDAPRRADAEGPLRLIIVGRLVRQKGVDVALAAMSRVKCEVSLTVVGDGPCRAELAETAVELGLADKVRFLGWLDREAMPKAYAEAEAMVFPSRDEGMPNVVLEAMASGLPVVGTDIPGTRDLVADGVTGVLTAVDDVAAVAAAVEALAADPERRAAMGAAGRRRVCERFSWSAAARRYTAYFDPAEREV
jgi:glycosyltransferase involved in cell wall biosynthesis